MLHGWDGWVEVAHRLRQPHTYAIGYGTACHIWWHACAWREPCVRSTGRQRAQVACSASAAQVRGACSFGRAHQAWHACAGRQAELGRRGHAQACCLCACAWLCTACRTHRASWLTLANCSSKSKTIEFLRTSESCHRGQGTGPGPGPGHGTCHTPWWSSVERHAMACGNIDDMVHKLLQPWPGLAWCSVVSPHLGQGVENAGRG